MRIQNKFKKALKCGTGKAYFILKGNPDIDFSRIIKKSLLKRMCYDGQCDGHRGNYYYELMQVSPQKEALIKFVLKELQKDHKDWYVLVQLYEIAALIGVNEGHEEAVEGVRKRFRKEMTETDDRDGENALLRIDGVKAFLGLVRLKGMLLKKNPDWSEYGGLITQFDKLYPKANGSKILKRASLQNVFIKEYWKRVQKHKNRKKKIEKGKQAKYKYKNIVKTIKKSRFFWVSDQVKDLDEWTIYRLALALNKEKNAKRQQRYLDIFAKCKFPLGLEVLFDFIEQKHQTPKSLVEPAVKALALFQSKKIRSYALKKLKKKKDILIYLPLLICNYKAGDHLLLDDILQMKWNTEEIHELNYIYRSIYRKNAPKESRLPLKRIYDQLNCGICREAVLETMLDNKVLTTEILKEMKLDCHEPVRELYKKLKRSKKKKK